MRVKVDVCKNDQIGCSDMKKYDKIILSPGPGIPKEAGSLLQVIHEYAPTKSILGVCLGHQAIAEAFGGGLINLKSVYHGVATPIKIIAKNCKLFAGMDELQEVGRYHSWVVDQQKLPNCFMITAIDFEGHIMGIQHNNFDVYGVQFHPESILTPCGERLINNWLLA